MPMDMLITEARGMTDDALMEVVRFMRFLKAERKESAVSGDKAEGKKRRYAGKYAGQIWMAEDFDAPMEEFREYM